MAKSISGEAAFPLAWPEGEPRTPPHKRQRARFELRFAAARDDLLEELRRLKARYPVLSTNVSLRRDGLPYASAPPPADPGVAVYFLLDDDQMVFACDKWDKVEDNVRAIGKTIEALRGISRWGARNMMKRAFSAFKALPAADWRSVMGILDAGVTLEQVKARYRELAAKLHPDTGGSHHAMQRLNAAWEQAQKELG
jgi:hypothetical protein